MKTYLAVLAALALSSSASFAKTPDEDYAPIKALYDQASTLAQADLSCNAAADCVSVAIGSRGCGGPAAFFVTGAGNSKLDELRSVADKATAAEEEFNSEHQIVSTCEIRMPQAPTCQANRCQK